MEYSARTSILMQIFHHWKERTSAARVWQELEFGKRKMIINRKPWMKIYYISWYSVLNLSPLQKQHSLMTTHSSYSSLVDSQDWSGLEIFLVHSFGLAYLQDFCVAQILQATLELVQRIRLESQCTHDLLPHHLHYLQRTRERRTRWGKSSRPPETHEEETLCLCFQPEKQTSQKHPSYLWTKESTKVSAPDRINDVFSLPNWSPLKGEEQCREFHLWLLNCAPPVKCMTELFL